MSKLEQLKEHIEKMGMKPLRTEHRKDVRRPLTQSELEAIAIEMGTHVLKAKELEDQKKEITKTLGDAQKKEDAFAQALAQKQKDKYSEEPADVLIVANYEEKVRMVFVIETGMMVAKEKLEEKDLQVGIFDEGEAAATGAQDVPEAPRAPEPIAIGYEKGKEVIEVEGVVVDDATLSEVVGGMAEPKVLTTQIRMIEVQRGINFITTAEKIILFTEDKDLMAKAKKAMDQKGHVKINYLHVAEARNHEIQMIEEVELVGMEQVLEELGQEIPDGFEAPDDPDRDAGEGAGTSDDDFEDPDL